MVRERGARAVILTYPSDNGYYRGASRLILEVSSTLDVPVIDLHERFKTLCAMRDCQPLFFPDGHPTAAGYAEVASIIAAWLAQNVATPRAS
jgi:lysophospholipase L1-like esterase